MPNSSLERVFAHLPDRARRPSGRYPSRGGQSSHSERRLTCFGPARVLNLTPNLKAGHRDSLAASFRLPLIRDVRESGSSFRIVKADRSTGPLSVAQALSRSPEVTSSVNPLGLRTCPGLADCWSPK